MPRSYIKRVKPVSETEKSAIDTQSPEFKAAVAEALQGLIPEIVKEFANVRPASIPEADDNSAIFNGLAMAIATLTDQGTGQKRVAPEVVAHRSRERERMGKLIMAARERTEKEGAPFPQYRALNKLYLNERKIEPFRRENNVLIPVVFGWGGVPSEYMYPMDDTAKEIFTAFLNSIGSTIEGPSAMEKPLWATPSGLIIQGEAPVSLKQAPTDLTRKFADGLDLKLPNDPRAKEIHILGTIHPPAKTNEFDGVGRRAA